MAKCLSLSKSSMGVSYYCYHSILFLPSSEKHRLCGMSPSLCILFILFMLRLLHSSLCHQSVVTSPVKVTNNL